MCHDYLTALSSFENILFNILNNRSAVQFHDGKIAFPRRLTLDGRWATVLKFPVNFIEITTF